MLANINKLVSPLKDSLTDLFAQGVTTCGHFAGRAVNYLEHLPSHMQNNQHIAVAVFVVSNTIFLSLTNLFANIFNNCIDRYGKNLTTDQKELTKNIVVNGVFVGGAVGCLNYTLSKATQYAFADQRLNAAALTAVTVATIVARILLKPKTVVETPHIPEGLKTPKKKDESEKDGSEIDLDDSDIMSPPKSSDEAAVLQAQIEKDQARILELQEKITAFEKNLYGPEHFRATLETAINNEKALKKSLAQANQELTKLKKDLEDAMNVSGDLLKEAKTAKNDLASANTQIKTLEASLKELQSKYDANLLALKVSQQEIALIQEQLAAANQQIAISKQSLAEKEYDLSTLQATLKINLDTYETLQKKYKALERELQALKAKYIKLQETTASKSDELRALHSKHYHATPGKGSAKSRKSSGDDSEEEVDMTLNSTLNSTFIDGEGNRRASGRHKKPVNYSKMNKHGLGSPVPKNKGKEGGYKA